MAKRAVKPRGAGRPKLAAGRARDRILRVRLTEEEWARVQAYVDKENAEIDAEGGDGTVATVSSWIRDLIHESIPSAKWKRAS